MDGLRKNVGGKLLRCGYTTGACAAGAAKAAAIMLLSGKAVFSVSLPTPKGIELTLDVLDAQIGPRSARCAIRKDGGDDPDVTDGMRIRAEVERAGAGICIDGGEGIGRVTRPGLDQPVGAAAINATPRRMIAEAVEAVCARYGYAGGLLVRISAPEGEEIAGRTFNPRMGIEGGISIIGTSGIVEPMSSAALVDTIRLELRQLAAAGEKGVLLTPGNYGEAFAAGALALSLNAHISCANFIGDAIDAAVELGFERILLVGHIGKLVKLGLGITNTHSANGDGRIEALIACALLAGAPLALLREIASNVAADAALALLRGAGLLEKTMDILGARIGETLRRRVPAGVEIGYLCFTNAKDFGGILSRSENAGDLLRIWRKEI